MRDILQRIQVILSKKAKIGLMPGLAEFQNPKSGEYQDIRNRSGRMLRAEV